MAKRLQHQISGVPHCRNNRPGCMWGLLHLLNLHQHLRIRKMLAHWRHHDGIKIPKSKQNICSAEVEHDCLDKDASIPMEDKVDTKARSSAKARKRNLLSKRKSREHDQMRQISPSASRMLRTISIHHLESRDFALPDELPSDGETSISEVNSHETDSSASGEYAPLLPKAPDGPILRKRCEVCGTINTMNQLDELGNHLLEKQSLLRGKLTEAKEALLNQKGTDTREVGDVELQQSEEFLETMELFNSNRELFLRILQDPGFVLTNYLQSQQAFSAELTKSGSFPGAGLSVRKNNVGIGLLKSESATSFGLLPGSPHKLKDQREKGTVSNRFKAIKQRIKYVIKENRKEWHRVSMEGILHKIPYGHKLSVNMKKEMQALCEGPRLDGYEKDGSRSKFRCNNDAPKIIPRSHSLTESLDKYSRLLESISSRGSEKSPNILRGMKSPKNLKRISSLPEFNSYSLSNDFHDEALNEAENKESDTVVEQPMEVNVTGDPKQQVLIDEIEQEIRSEVEPCDSSTDPQSQLGVDLPDGVGDGEADIDDKVQISTAVTDINSFHVQVDPNDEADFNFVRDILLKSGFISDEYLGAWYSPYQPVDPLLFEQAEGSSHEADITGDESDTSIDHQLLFDLINEILMEIYDTSFACCPWLRRFNSRVKPTPVGHHVLEEVWANISWCLSYQLRLDPTVDSTVARDYARNDGWMCLQGDTEEVALELEDMILDDLLDEVVLHLGDLSGALCNPS